MSPPSVQTSAVKKSVATSTSMCADKLLPGGRRLPLGSRRDAMALEDVAHRLVADRQAQVGQGADNPVTAPGAILLGYTHDQGLQFWIDRGASRRLALRRAVTLLSHKPAVPGENGVRFDDGGDFLQGLLAELLAHLSQGLPLAVTQPNASWDLMTQDTILCHQVLIA